MGRRRWQGPVAVAGWGSQQLGKHANKSRQLEDTKEQCGGGDSNRRGGKKGGEKITNFKV